MPFAIEYCRSPSFSPSGIHFLFSMSNIDGIPSTAPTRKPSFVTILPIPIW